MGHSNCFPRIDRVAFPEMPVCSIKKGRHFHDTPFPIGIVELIPVPVVVAGTTAVSATTALRRSFFPGPGFVYTNVAPVEGGVVKLRNSLLGGLVVRHFDKGETTGTARYLVGDDLCGGYFAKGAENVDQVFILEVEAQVRYINVHNNKLTKLKKD